MHSAIPVLQVSNGNVLVAHGTSDVLADVATKTRFSEQLAPYRQLTLQSATAGEWGRVHRGLLTFNDPELRMPAIDWLKGVHPGGSSLYSEGSCAGMY